MSRPSEWQECELQRLQWKHIELYHVDDLHSHGGLFAVKNLVFSDCKCVSCVHIQPTNMSDSKHNNLHSIKTCFMFLLCRVYLHQ